MAAHQPLSPLTTEVPQGSVAGTGIFPVCTKPIGTVAREHGINLHLYEDDTQLYVVCPLRDQEMTKQQLESCVADVRDWMAANMLKLNDSKTEYTVKGSKHTLYQVLCARVFW